MSEYLKTTELPEYGAVQYASNFEPERLSENEKVILSIGGLITTPLEVKDLLQDTSYRIFSVVPPYAKIGEKKNKAKTKLDIKKLQERLNLKLVKFVTTLLDSQKIRGKIDRVMGNSHGGLLATRYAMQNPALVKKIALIASAGGGEKIIDENSGKNAKFLFRMRKSLSNKDPEALKKVIEVSNTIKADKISDDLIQGVMHLLCHENLNDGLFIYANNARAGGEVLTSEELKVLKNTEKIIISAKDDPITKRENQEIFAQALGLSIEEIIEIEGDHGLWHTSAPKLIKTLRDKEFLETPLIGL